MPAKKDRNKKKKEDKKNFEIHATHFRDLLLAARKEYAKGRSISAEGIVTEALVYGSQHIPRFEDSSLTKAHALVELALFTSAICSDFAQGQECTDKFAEHQRHVNNAMKIYNHRMATGTLVEFRKEEVWIKGNDYLSAVPHTERLGPMDYLSCVNLVGARQPTPGSVAAFKHALQFAHAFTARGRVLTLEAGGALEGMVADESLYTLQQNLRRHEQLLTGIPVDVENDSPKREDLRHTGTLTGKMKPAHDKLARDTERIGLRECSNAKCDKTERQPREFSTCSRCKLTPYCSRECQATDWKAGHKKTCKPTVVADKNTEPKK